MKAEKRAYNMRQEGRQRMALLFATVTFIFASIVFFDYVVFAQVCTRMSTGPYLLAEICRENGIDTTVEEIEQLAGTDKGITSFWGLKIAAEELGFTATGLKTDIEHLRELVKNGYILVLFSRNHTYVRVKDVSERLVKVHNPSSYPKSDSIPINIFEKQWDGKLLLVKEKEDDGI